jgi:predicted DsbA family dithiol-disulfide isomerase
MSSPLDVHVWSDIACPWCFIGKRRFEEAVRRFGGQVSQMLEQMTDLAAAEGLHDDFAAVRHTKTLLAHQAIHHAKAEGKQLELVERLFHAYFEQGRHLGHLDELVDLAAEVGLDGAELRAALTAGTYAAAVRQDIAEARDLGIRDVPFYVIDNAFGVSGAQSPEVFVSALERAAEARAAEERTDPLVERQVQGAAETR